MHLENYLVLWVTESLHVIILIHPGPGASPGIFFNKDELRGGSGGADAINGSLVQLQNDLLLDIAVLVVCYNLISLISVNSYGFGHLLVSKIT